MSRDSAVVSSSSAHQDQCWKQKCYRIMFQRYRKQPRMTVSSAIMRQRKGDMTLLNDLDHPVPNLQSPVVKAKLTAMNNPLSAPNQQANPERTAEIQHPITQRL
ncbi:unnamed protein product [Polarella glacialis]|uniref:Uncharacterized protein n=1 Tax=Polarella glacialis TaxID=89957 RepID=A0A813H2A6_POLGL|nr:unnamed protein product [Polarella glacialis]